MLSNSSLKDIQVRYPRDAYGQIYADSALCVQALYQRGLTNEAVRLANEDIIHGEKMWSNAEDFIDYVDSAGEPEADGSTKPNATRLAQIVATLGYKEIPIEQLRVAVRRLIAAECCAFLEGADPESERWAPFRAWEAYLGPNDTVVTFNYDRVIELLGEAHNRLQAKLGLPRGATFKVIRPGSEFEDMGEARAAGLCPVLKLHGSVDWQLQHDSRERIRITNNRRFALACGAKEIAIATPGPSKARTAALYDGIWELSSNAMRDADVIVFVGYRFPETDAQARAALLNPLGESAKTLATTTSPSTLCSDLWGHTWSDLRR